MTTRKRICKSRNVRKHSGTSGPATRRNTSRHARITAKLRALEGLGNRGQGTVGAQNGLFDEGNIPQMFENIGGRDRGRTGDLIVANDVKKFIRRGAATTYVF